MDADLKNLPKHIRDVVVVDKKINVVPLDKGLLNYTNKNGELKKIVRELDGKCIIDGKSLYSMTDYKYVDGFHCRVLKKGTNIYKVFPGFSTEGKIKKYLSQNVDYLSFFGNKYFPYKLALDNYGSVVSFKCNRNIILIDWWNSHNLNKIISLMKAVGYGNYIQTFKIQNGYKITVEDQIKAIYDKYVKIKKWDSIYYYSKPVLNGEFPYQYCDYRNITNFNPMLFKGTFYVDKVILSNIIRKYKRIDGVLRDIIPSKLEMGGLFLHEELIIKNRTILDSLKIDYDDKLHWENWGIKNKLNIPNDGIILNYDIINISVDYGEYVPKKKW